MPRTPHYICWLHGGLGNQLFQWAMVTALAKRHGGHAWGDRSCLAVDTLRTYCLDQFQIDLPEPPEELVEKIIGRPRYMDTPGDRRPPLIRKLSNFYQSLLPWDLRARVQEQCMLYQPRLARRRTSAYLDGFWQSELYFADCAEHIRSQLVLRHTPGQDWQTWHEAIGRAPAIGLHIRRGDYVTNDYVTKNIGPCAPDYYTRAVKHHHQHHGSLPVFIFTDDPEWALHHFANTGWQVVSGTGTWNDAAEMTLLSRCTHFVLSNSSFSWWAAWISQAPAANIIVPEPWFDQPGKTHIHPAPASWNRMPKK